MDIESNDNTFVDEIGMVDNPNSGTNASSSRSTTTTITTTRNSNTSESEYFVNDRVRFLFTSSIASVGPVHTVTETSRPKPQSTYGITKAMAELLVSDYHRKGFLDGRIIRIPTIIVRPGQANAAGTSAYSSLVREIMKGNDYSIPIDKDHIHPVCSVNHAVSSILQLLEVDSEAIGTDRIINLPGISVSLEEILFHTEQIGEALGIPLGRVSEKLDPLLDLTVKAMHSYVKLSNHRIDELGLKLYKQDMTIENILQQYIDDVYLDDKEDIFT